jgi:hypothetical protein
VYEVSSALRGNLHLVRRGRNDKRNNFMMSDSVIRDMRMNVMYLACYVFNVVGEI